MKPYLLISLIFPVVLSAPGYDKYQMDYKDNDYREFHQVKDSPYPRTGGMAYQQPTAHIFPNFTRCTQECEGPCQMTAVYLNEIATKMFACSRLKPKKENLIASIWSNSFYKTLLVLGAIVVAVLVLLTLAFCCSYCCRASSNSSRGSSKDALNPNEDGEFRGSPSSLDRHHFHKTLHPREYLPEENGSMKREYRRPHQRTALAV